MTDIAPARLPAAPVAATASDTETRLRLATMLIGLRGELFLPEHPGWDEARRAWNLAVDQHPLAVVEPDSADDIAAVVRAAGQLGLRVAAQTTGHNAAPLGELSDTILVRTRRMNRVHIDAQRMIARVGAGAVWADVIAPAAEAGLAALAGSAPDVGVVGYTLGGGLSWLARSHGLAANSVTAVELVTGDGVVRRVEATISLPTAADPAAPASSADVDGANTEATDADILWALRGGGGNIGIVTTLEFRLYPLTEVYAGALFWPIDRAHDVLHAWRLWAEDVPPSVTSVARVLRLPPLPELPPFLSGRSLVVIEAVVQEPAEVGAELIGMLRVLEPEVNTFEVVPVPALAGLHMDPPGPVPGAGDGTLIRELTAEFIDDFVAVAGPDSELAAPLLSVELRHLGGELAPARGEGGAVSSLDAEAALYAVGMAPSPEALEAIDASTEAVLEALEPWRAETEFANFAEKRRTPEALFGASLDRLRAVRAALDPKGVIRSNHPLD